MTGIIDIHTHILPGVDDGSRDWDESRKMLEEAYRQGTRHIIATPHYSRRGLEPGLHELAHRLQEEAGRLGPDFTIGLGQETYFHEGLVENLKAGKALTLQGTRYVLVEFDPGTTCHSLYQAVRKMQQARYIPVIAHVERYCCLREQKNLEELIRRGCLLQMNYSSLEGRGLWNRDVRWCRRQVLEGRIDFLSTDMHRMDYRRPDIKGSLKWLETHLGDHELKALVCRNADRLLLKKITGE